MSPNVVGIVGLITCGSDGSTMPPGALVVGRRGPNRMDLNPVALTTSCMVSPSCDSSCRYCRDEIVQRADKGFFEDNLAILLEDLRRRTNRKMTEME